MMNFSVLDFCEGETKSINSIENIDVDKLNHIITHFKEFEGKLDDDGTAWFKNKDGKFGGLKKILSNYLKNYRTGGVKVEFIQKNNVGRMFAKRSLSIQSLPRKIRHTIAKDSYNDIDIVNCHPVLLVHLCEKYDIECPSLRDFVCKRESIFKEIGEDRESLKIKFLKIINGGKIDNITHPILIKFNRELKKIRKLICHYNTDKFVEHRNRIIKDNKKDTYNIDGKFLNIVLCDIENKVLNCMYEFYEKNDNAVLVFDGIMLPKDIEPRLIECQKHIGKTLGIWIKLKLKDMDEGFTIDNPKKYVIKELYFHDYNDVVNHAYTDLYDNKVVDWIKESIYLIDNTGKNMFVVKGKKFDKLTGINGSMYQTRKLIDVYNSLHASVYFKNPNYDPKATYGPSTRKHLFDNLSDYLKFHVVKHRMILTYRNITFYPHLKREEYKNINNEFNVFAGFPFDNGNYEYKEGSFETSKLYIHLKDHLLNGDEAEFNHFLDFIADMIQCPSQIRSNPHLFSTPQGCGKGMMAHFLTKMVGVNYMISYENIDNYFSNFNLAGSGKILKVIEEVASKGKAFDQFNRIKAEVSMERERVEPKGVDSYEMPHSARFLFFTNNDNALRVEKDDRRFTMHKTEAGPWVNNPKHFQPIWDEIHDNKFCKNAFNYFCNRKYEVSNVMKPFENKYKNQQKESCIPVSLEFLIDFINDEEYSNTKIDPYNGEPLNRIYDGWIKKTELKTYFKDWCLENGRKYNSGTFLTQLKLLKLDEKLRKIKGAKRDRCYNISIENVEELFKVYLRNPEFKLIKE